MGSTSRHHDRLSPTPDRRSPERGVVTSGLTRRNMMELAALGLLGSSSGAASTTLKGQLTWALHVSLAPIWFDPADTGGIITPFLLLYALHDGLMKPMPGNPSSLCLAKTHTESTDGLSHEFLLRDGT